MPFAEGLLYVLLTQVAYLVREVWRGLSARGPGHVLLGADKGVKRSLANLSLTRYACWRSLLINRFPRLAGGGRNTEHRAHS